MKNYSDFTLWQKLLLWAILLLDCLMLVYCIYALVIHNLTINGYYD